MPAAAWAARATRPFSGSAHVHLCALDAVDAEDDSRFGCGVLPVDDALDAAPGGIAGVLAMRRGFVTPHTLPLARRSLHRDPVVQPSVFVLLLDPY